MTKEYWRTYYHKNKRTARLALEDYRRRNQARPDVMAMAARLRAEREGLGISQRELARRIGCRSGSVSAWETGKIPVNVERIAAAMPELGAKLQEGRR